jgi:hypothetical protein
MFLLRITKQVLRLSNGFGSSLLTKKLYRPDELLVQHRVDGHRREPLTAFVHECQSPQPPIITLLGLRFFLDPTRPWR